jgi:hypothetical protein
LAAQNPVFQIAAILWLGLADVSVTFHLNALATKMTANMAKLNDFIVFLLSYFPILYAGAINDPELAYQIGWVQCALVGIMFWANLAVLMKTMISGMMEECRKVRVEKLNLHTLKGMGFVMVIVVETVW